MRTRPALRLGLAFLLGASAFLAAATGPAAAAPGASPGDSVELALSRARVSTRLGDGFDFGSTIRNVGTTTLPSLVAHLNIVSLTKGVYVDPEDWSSQRTHYLASLRPGQSTRVSWKVESVNGGDFAIYVVVLPDRDPSSSTLAVSPALDLHVTERKTLNSGGVLPLALGIPGFLGLLILGLRFRRS
jgi:hypothetical protein